MEIQLHRQYGRRQRPFEEVAGPHGEDHAADSARGREHHALAQELLCQTESRRTQSAAHREFTLPHRPPNQEQIADVHARNQQHQSDHGRQQGRGDLVRTSIAGMRNAPQHFGGDPWTGFRWRAIFRSQLCIDAVQIGSDLRRLDRRIHPADQHQSPRRTIVQARRHGRARADRYPHIGAERRQDTNEFPRSDAGDRV